MATIAVHRLLFVSRVNAAYFSFLTDRNRGPVYVQVDLDGEVSASTISDPKMPIELRCTVDGQGNSEQPIDVLNMILTSPDIYLEHMVRDALDRARSKGHIIHWT